MYYEDNIDVNKYPKLLKKHYWNTQNSYEYHLSTTEKSIMPQNERNINWNEITVFKEKTNIQNEPGVFWRESVQKYVIIHVENVT